SAVTCPEIQFPVVLKHHKSRKCQTLMTEVAHEGPPRHPPVQVSTAQQGWFIKQGYSETHVPGADPCRPSHHATGKRGTDCIKRFCRYFGDVSAQPNVIRVYRPFTADIPLLPGAQEEYPDVLPDSTLRAWATTVLFTRTHCVSAWR
ncbi:unnamed protein product, partial [Oncorhynchus mykiss]